MAWSELIGSQLDRYVVTAELGRGGTSRVYRARDPERPDEVAIKVMLNQAEDRQSFVHRFKREIEVMGQLNHRNIIKILGSGQTPDLVYLVMECITGGTLRQVFGHPLAIPQAVHYITQMAEALHYAHQKGIIHRDVKPSNMLVDDKEQGRIVLSDFGIAKVYQAQGLTKSGTTIGTPEYMAPEQAEGLEIDHRADIYSLGCVLYEALVGRPPFEGATPVSVLYQQVHAHPPYIRGFNPDVPRDLSHIVARMLAKRPEDRYTSAAQVAEMLRPFLTESPYADSTRMTEAPLLHPPEGPADPGFAPLELSRGVELIMPERGALTANAQAPRPPAFSDISQLPTAPPALPTGLPGLSEVSTQPLDQGTIPAEQRPEAAAPPGPRGQRRTLGSQPLRLPARGSGPLPPNSGPLPPGIAALPDEQVDAALSHLGGAGNPPAASGAPSVAGRMPAPAHPLPHAAPAPMGPAARWSTAGPPIAEVTPPAWQTPAHGVHGSAWDPATDEVPTVTVPAPLPRRGQRRRQQRQARRVPRGALLAIIVLLVLVAGGWMGTRALGGQFNAPGQHPVGQAKTPTAAPSPSPSPTATPTPKPSPTTTPTPTVQQRLDAQAAASFRGVVLGTFQDGSCSQSYSKTHFTSGQFVTINLCTASSVAPGPMTIAVRQNGAVVLYMAQNIYLAPNGSYYYQRYLSPGAYDVLVTITLNGYQAVARDLAFTVE